MNDIPARAISVHGRNDVTQKHLPLEDKGDCVTQLLLFYNEPRAPSSQQSQRTHINTLYKNMQMKGIMHRARLAISCTCQWVIDTGAQPTRTATVGNVPPIG